MKRDRNEAKSIESKTGKQSREMKRNGCLAECHFVQGGAWKLAGRGTKLLLREGPTHFCSDVVTLTATICPIRHLNVT